MPDKGTKSSIRSSFFRPVLSAQNAIILLCMSIVFIIALFMRIYPAQYGWFINEFDPYYDYYAALHVVTLAEQHGLVYALFNNPSNCTPAVLTSCHNLQGYFYWHDIKTWWPYGRNVAATSQVGLQLTGAILYLFVSDVLRFHIGLYNFIVFFPVLFGSLTIIPIYFLVKKISGSPAGGIFTALMFSVSPPILERGNLGWFKSEPYSLFLSTIGAYFFLTMYDENKTRNGLVTRALIAGAMFGYAIISWGGAEEYALLLALVFLVAPFVKQLDLKKTITGGSIVISVFLLIAAMTPRPGPTIISDITGLGLMGSWLFAFLAYLFRTPGVPTISYKQLAKVFLLLAVSGLLLVAFVPLGSISTRYLTVVDSFFRQGNPLTQSVAEEAVPTGSLFFSNYGALILLAGLGAYFAFRRKTLESLFALGLGITGVYIASSFSRLMVYSTIALGVLAAIGFVELANTLLKPSNSKLTKRPRLYETRSETKVVFVVFMIILLALPMFWPPNSNFSSAGYQLTHSGWNASANVPVSVVNGGTSFLTQSSDWMQAFNWIRQTPQNSTIVAWWDYGYWIAVMGNRTTLADNATINETQIAQIGRVLVSDPHTSLQVLTQLHKPTYILTFVAGERFTSSSQFGSQTYYTLTVQAPYPQPAGGDESKKQWFIRIGNTVCNNCLEETNGSRALMYPDDFTPTPYFWANSTLGQLFPFSPTHEYLSPTSSTPVSGYNATISSGSQSGITAGYTALYTYDMKMTANNSTAPFQLVFESSSLPGSGDGLFSAVLIYKINYNSPYMNETWSG